MGFLRSISRLIQDTWKIWLALIVVLGAIWAVYDPVRKWVAGELEKQIVTGAGQPSLAALPSHLITVGIFAGLFLALAASYMALARSRDAARRSERETLLNTFLQSTQAADLICEQLFPGTAAPVKKVLRFKEVFTFYADGDCHCLQEMTIAAAVGSDVHFYEMEIAGDPAAAPAAFPEDVQLQVAAASGQSLTYLISANEPLKKRLVIFFLPFIRAGATDQRAVTATYYWPGLMRRLFTRGDEEFVDQLSSVDPVPEVEYQFWIKPRAGRLTCRQIGKKLPGEKLEVAGPNANGMVGWTYRAANVPVNHETKLRLELR